MGGVGVRHVWQSCEKRRDDSSKLQYKVYKSITQPLYFVG